MIAYTEDPLFWQRFLSCAGYPLALDGAWGPKSKAAAKEFEASSAECAQDYGGSFDPRSEGNIQTLLPKVQLAARNFLGRAKAAMATHGIDVKIISGTRTFAQQDDLYAQGRSKSGNVVTNARGGQSNHNFGVAWDVGLFQGSAYLDESPHYRELGQLGKSMGLEWGGDWASIQDEPHFQTDGDGDLATIVAKFEVGEAYV